MTVQEMWEKMSTRVRQAFSARSAGPDDAVAAPGPAQPETRVEPPDPVSRYVSEDEDFELSPAEDRPRLREVRRVDTSESLKQLPVKLDALAERMSKLDRLVDQLDALSTGETALPRRVAEALKDAGVGKVGEELLEPLRDLSSESQKQTDLLDEMHKQLSAGGEVNVQLVRVIERLAESGEAARRSEAARTELMEQIRDHLANSNADLVETVSAQTRRMRQLVIAAVALLGAILLALVTGMVIR